MTTKSQKSSSTPVIKPPAQKKLKPIIICMPTRNGESDTMTMFTSSMLNVLTGRPVALVLDICGQIVRGRNECVERVGDVISRLPDNQIPPTHLLWIDSDMCFAHEHWVAITECLAHAESHTSTVCGLAYARADEVPAMTTIDDDGTVCDDDEMFQRVRSLGWGATVVPYEPEYIYHADARGEDVHYVTDHPTTKFYVHRRVIVPHRKYIPVTITPSQAHIEASP